jgi:hypothetical protein
MFAQATLYRALMAVEVQRAKDTCDVITQYFQKVEAGWLNTPDPAFRVSGQAGGAGASGGAAGATPSASRRSPTPAGKRSGSGPLCAEQPCHLCGCIGQANVWGLGMSRIPQFTNGHLATRGVWKPPDGYMHLTCADRSTQSPQDSSPSCAVPHLTLSPSLVVALLPGGSRPGDASAAPGGSAAGAGAGKGDGAGAAAGAAAAAAGTSGSGGAGPGTAQASAPKKATLDMSAFGVRPGDIVVTARIPARRRTVKKVAAAAAILPNMWAAAASAAVQAIVPQAAVTAAGDEVDAVGAPATGGAWRREVGPWEGLGCCFPCCVF